MLTVLFAPYMITVAGRAAGCPDPDETCSRTVSLLGLDLAAGSLPAYLTTFATIASAFVLPVVGAFVDGSAHKKRHMAGFAWAGALAGSLLFFMEGDDWQLGAVAVVAASILGGCSLVSYYAILVDISTVEERDRVSSRGWAWGYLGGGLLLLLNLVVVLGHDAFGIGTELAVRSRCSRRRCGGRASRSCPSCGCATTSPPPRRRRARAPSCSAASGSCGPRCASCAATR